jgi:hypothetical protein
MLGPVHENPLLDGRSPQSGFENEVVVRPSLLSWHVLILHRFGRCQHALGYCTVGRMHNEYLTASQVARRLGLSTERVRQLVHLSQLNPISTPLGRLFDVTEVDQLAERRRRDGLKGARR